MKPTIIITDEYRLKQMPHWAVQIADYVMIWNDNGTLQSYKWRAADMPDGIGLAEFVKRLDGQK